MSTREEIEIRRPIRILNNMKGDNERPNGI